MEGTKKAGPKCAPASLLIAEVKGWAAILSNMAKNGFNDFALKIKTADLIVLYLSSLLLDNFCRNQGFYRAILLYRLENSYLPSDPLWKFSAKDCLFLITAADNFSIHLNRWFLIMVLTGKLTGFHNKGMVLNRRLQQYQRQAPDCQDNLSDKSI